MSDGVERHGEVCNRVQVSEINSAQNVQGRLLPCDTQTDTWSELPGYLGKEHFIQREEKAGSFDIGRHLVCFRKNKKAILDKGKRRKS